ncbi:MAG: thioredoxin family protein [Bacteroidetes bacterium]|nr:thioredoxin family protein [Bacteroidota bacterium]MBS1977210.1 thioredoxin family protein [Bacteroidota bacterium]
MRKGWILLGILSAALTAFRPSFTGYEIGDTATDFKLKNVDGTSVSLADYKDAKGFIVVFDCNTCPYSKAYNSRIIALNEKYVSKGFPLIAINASDNSSPGESTDDNISKAKKHTYKFPYLIDETQGIARAYGATNTPHVFVLNRTPQGLKVAYIGTIDDNPRSPDKVTVRYVEDAIDALLSGKEVPVKKTKAIGCTIKWKPA